VSGIACLHPARGAFHLAKIFGLKFQKLSVSNETVLSIWMKSLIRGSKLSFSLAGKRSCAMVQEINKWMLHFDGEIETFLTGRDNFDFVRQN